MSLRPKILLTLILTLLCLIGVLYLVLSTILTQSFAEVETKEARQDTQRVIETFASDSAALNNVAQQWGLWDDSYTFMQDRNAVFLTANFSQGSLDGANTNGVIFLDNAGTIVAGTGYDLVQHVRQAIPNGLSAYLGKTTPLLRATQQQSGVFGIVVLSGKPAYIAAQPILKTDGTGDERGVVVLLRWLDDAAVKSVATRTHIDLTLLPIAGSALPADFVNAHTHLALAEKVPIYTQPLSDDISSGYTILRDVREEPMLLARIDTDRDISKRGQQSLVLMIVALVVVGLVFTIVAIFLLEGLFLRRLAYLAANVQGIGPGNTTRIHIKGKDELAQLGDVINTAFDALEHAQRERERAAVLAAENELFSVTLGGIADAVITTDADGRVVLANTVAQTLIGGASGDLHGQRLADAVHFINHLTNEPLSNGVTEVLTTAARAEITADAHLVRADGSVRRVVATAAPLVDTENTLIGTVLVVRDITEKATLEEKQQIILQQLNQAARLAALGELASTVAHEINNPLTAIVGLREVELELAPPGSLLAKTLKTILTESVRCGTIVQGLLHFARRGEIVYKPTDITEPIALALMLTKNRCALARITLVTDIAPTMPLAQANADQLTQVLLNLINNAIDACENTGDQIIVRVWSDADQLKISISDTGIGIPPRDLGRIFEAFYTTKADGRGTGLGLSISQGIIEQHNGRLQVESAVNGGTTFTISLPVAPASNATDSEPRLSHAISD